MSAASRVESIVLGASSKANIQQTKQLIEQYSPRNRHRRCTSGGASPFFLSLCARSTGGPRRVTYGTAIAYDFLHYVRGTGNRGCFSGVIYGIFTVSPGIAGSHRFR